MVRRILVTAGCGFMGRYVMRDTVSTVDNVLSLDAVACGPVQA